MLSLDECMQQFNEEMQKPVTERDMPKLMRLWSHKDFFQDRRNKISVLKAGAVKELIVAYPLLHCLPFVSLCICKVQLALYL